MSPRQVATVGEPGSTVVWGDGGEDSPGSSAEIVVGAWRAASERLLEFGEGEFDGVEVGRIGWQMPELSTPRFDGCPSALVMVGAEVVRNNDLAAAQRGCEHMPDVPHEPVARHRPIESQQGADPRQGERCDDGLLLTLIAWR